jgi:hypothetical protein
MEHFIRQHLFWNGWLKTLRVNDCQVAIHFQSDEWIWDASLCRRVSKFDERSTTAKLISTNPARWKIGRRQLVCHLRETRQHIGRHVYPCSTQVADTLFDLLYHSSGLEQRNELPIYPVEG